jgi:hypothetical protein
MLSACATTKKPEVAEQPPVPTLVELLAKAADADTAGRKEDAVTLWKEAAAAYPVDKAPAGPVSRSARWSRTRSARC